MYGYHVCSAVSLLGTQRVVKLEEGLEGCCESGQGWEGFRGCAATQIRGGVVLE